MAGFVAGGPLSAVDRRLGGNVIRRRTVDYGGPLAHWLLRRAESAGGDVLHDAATVEPHPAWLGAVPPAHAHAHNAAMGVTTNFVHMSVNKARCTVECLAWTPEGRWLMTGSGTGEFTLWNGTTFNFESITQGHETAVRALCWTRAGNWLVSGDQSGQIRYWQPNLSNVKRLDAAHTESVRDISFAPSDLKFVSCSDDRAVKIWDFLLCREERMLEGHGWNVKSADWHPSSSLIVTGGKDQLVKLWDARSGRCAATLHSHKNSVQCTRWSPVNPHWFLSAGRDQVVKLHDTRTMRELCVFRGHRKEVTALRWHPHIETLFATGGYEGSLYYWNVGHEAPIGELVSAHELAVSDVAWHPQGHVLVSGSTDRTTKFWSRCRPGDGPPDRPLRPGTAMYAASDAMAMQEDAASFSYYQPAPGTIPGLPPPPPPHHNHYQPPPPPSYHHQQQQQQQQIPGLGPF